MQLPETWLKSKEQLGPELESPVCANCSTGAGSNKLSEERTGDYKVREITGWQEGRKGQRMSPVQCIFLP